MEIALHAAHDTRECCRRLATSFDEAEVALSAATATATSVLSIGTGDRTENEQDHMRKAQFLPNKTVNEEDREGHSELVAVENS